ncbi:MAG: hypothetical protein U9N84_04635 [Actinomycetota bacterium]|nr:hypothetical protein [Actinomycetota bacterium]
MPVYVGSGVGVYYARFLEGIHPASRHLLVTSVVGVEAVRQVVEAEAITTRWRVTSPMTSTSLSSEFALFTVISVANPPGLGSIKGHGDDTPPCS